MTQLTKESFKQFLDAHENFLFDCDGVLWHGNQLIPGASEALTALKKLGKKVYYVTNNSTSTRAQYVEKCSKLGLPATEADIVCSAQISAVYLKDMLKPTATYRPKVYVVGNPAMIAELSAVGIDGIGAEPDPVPDDFIQANFEKVAKFDPDVKAVLVGFDKHISYLKMLKAASYLTDPKIMFVVTNQDKTLPVVASRFAVPGTGAIVASVQTAAQREPVVIGKPSTLMIDFLKKENGLDTSRSVFFGDRLDTDIAVANNTGMKSLFVCKSGVSTMKDVENAKASGKKEDKLLIPTYVLDDITAFSKLIQ